MILCAAAWVTAPNAPVSTRAARYRLRTRSTTLTWQTTNATEVTIDNLGAVGATGSQQVMPEDSTTYHLVAKGPGGTQEADARVAVTVPPPPPAPLSSPSDEELFSQHVKDIFFDFDKYDIRADQQAPIQANAQFLQQHVEIRFTVEGHCDERGSIEYNLALGTSRADAVKSALTQAGVNGDRIKTVNYGKERPFCTESDGACWQQNRRGHYVYEK